MRTVAFLLILAAKVLGNDFLFDWKFTKGFDESSVEAGFDDSAWESVDLPHDWAISGPFGDLKEDGSTGKLPWRGEGTYRKHFTLPDAKNKRVQFLFDGVMASPEVYLNGRKIGEWTYGYNSFSVDGTEAANWGGENVLVVHADTRKHGSRWYPGAGIYRKVKMRVVGEIHIPFWGVFVKTSKVSPQSATISIWNYFKNENPVHAGIRYESEIIAPDGVVTPIARVSGVAESKAQSLFPLEITIKNPMLWDLEHPHLYQVVTRLFVDNEVQTETTSFGIRTVEFTADDGFHLNGRRLQLKGVNLHHDQGPLGAAFYPRAMERQLEIMKEMGVNAIRTSHNPSAPELLDLCDRMGFVVWNELFDKYGTTAGVDCNYDAYIHGYAIKEVANFVQRDRNHPCVINWSIGNEINGLQKWHVEKMVDYFKQYDDTRPIGYGSHVPDQAKKRYLDALDLTGWNYAQKYLVSRDAYPEQPLVYSESASAFGTRGAYKNDLPDNKLDYGNDGEINGHVLNAAPWSDIPEVEFERMRQHSYVAGEYVWTGFDYLGEPTPYLAKDRPMIRRADGALARSSYFGIVDLAGFPKDSYYLYRSHWNETEPTLHLAPHWNWEGMDGKPVPVFVYTDAPEAELFLNGKSLGRRKKLDPDEPNTANLAYGKMATASTEETKQDATGNVLAENLAQKAVDGNPGTRWCAAGPDMPQTLEIDLEEEREVSFVRINWEKEAAQYEFALQSSLDGTSWSEPDAKRETKGSMSEVNFESRKLRHLRVTVTRAPARTWASITELEVFEKPTRTENPYFKIVDAYRLRWLDVPYEPGELKAVAFRDGKPAEETTVVTAGPATSLRLTPDRNHLTADGMDLCYVTIEAIDAEGRPNPLATDDLTFEVEGQATLVGVGNGDAMGHDSFTDSTHPLFYGKAVAILRTSRKAGLIILRVSGDGLGTAECLLESE